MKPSGVYIIGTRFDIHFINKAQPSGFGVYAAMYFTRALIEIDANIAEGLQREFLWHETIHAIDRLLLDGGGLQAALVSNTQADCKRDNRLRLEEPIVLAFSRAQWQTMADPRNASVMAWILGTEATDG